MSAVERNPGPTPDAPTRDGADGRAAADGRTRGQRHAMAVWMLGAQADGCSADERDAFARRAAPFGRADRVLLVTCHRVELYGTGAPPDDRELARLDGTDGRPIELRLLEGGAAVLHAFRLAAGLESAVVGENEVLHQVRQLRESARHQALDPLLSRMLEAATGVGRRARSNRERAGIETDGLASRALAWLEREAPIEGGHVLVVGAGDMGRRLASEARRRRARVSVASRRVEHAAAVAAGLGGRAVPLEDAPSVAVDADAVAVALSGPWLLPGDVALPPTVDLSSPPALTARGAAAFLDIDGLYRWRDPAADMAPDQAYVEGATALAEDALIRFARWSAGRGSVETIRALRDRAEERRRDELERLVRKLPELQPRERALLEAFSEPLVAGILHAPTARLRDDVDGSAADAARRLFDL